VARLQARLWEADRPYCGSSISPAAEKLFFVRREHKLFEPNRYNVLKGFVGRGEEEERVVRIGGCMYIILHCIHADILRLSEHAAASNLYTELSRYSSNVKRRNHPTRRPTADPPSYVGHRRRKKLGDRVIRLYYFFFLTTTMIGDCMMTGREKSVT